MSLTHPDRLEVHDDNAEQPVPDAGAPHPTAVAQPSTSRPSFTITDAAAACAVSRKTITRKLPELAGHGAAKDEDGIWRIPVEALLAVGLRPGRSLPDATPASARSTSVRPPHEPAASPPRMSQDTITIARDRWDDLRIRLARAEAEASERALALADARLALRALTAGPAKSAPTPTSSPTGDPASSPAPPAQHSSGATDAQMRSGTVPAVVALSSGARAVPTGERHSAAPVVADAPAVAAPPVPPGATPEVVAARTRAAQTGGHVPAGDTLVKKRRWWQSAR